MNFRGPVRTDSAEANSASIKLSYVDQVQLHMHSRKKRSGTWLPIESTRSLNISLGTSSGGRAPLGTADVPFLYLDIIVSITRILAGEKDTN